MANFNPFICAFCTRRFCHFFPFSATDRGQVHKFLSSIGTKTGTEKPVSPHFQPRKTSLSLSLKSTRELIPAPCKATLSASPKSTRELITASCKAPLSASPKIHTLPYCRAMQKYRKILLFFNDFRLIFLHGYGIIYLDGRFCPKIMHRRNQWERVFTLITKNASSR